MWNFWYKIKLMSIKLDNDGRTAVFISSQNGYFPIVQLLVQNGADVNQADK